jgi:hypothetical protein
VEKTSQVEKGKREASVFRAVKERKFLPFGGKEISTRNGNKRTQMAECVGKSSLEPRKSPPFGG